jgi:hypothetical protein
MRIIKEAGLSMSETVIHTKFRAKLFRLNLKAGTSLAKRLTGELNLYFASLWDQTLR